MHTGSVPISLLWIVFLLCPVLLINPLFCNSGFPLVTDRPRMCFIHLGRSLGGAPAHSIPWTFGEGLDIVPALQQQGFGIWVMGFRRLAGPE